MISLSLLATPVLLALALAPGAQAAEYAIDAEHTYVFFEVLHQGTSTVRGRFDTLDGAIQFDPQAKTGTVSMQIDMASISTGSKGFDKHLGDADFFNTAQYPQSRFESTELLFDGDKVKAVQGELTLLGQTRPVTLDAIRFNCYHNKRIDKEVCGGDFQTVLERDQWGMSYGIPGIPNQVRIVIEVEAVRQ